MRMSLDGNTRTRQMKASVFVGTSLDGFIARANGDLDWLPHGSGEDLGYEAFMATVDALILGRNTFEYVDGGITIQRFVQAGLIQRLIITRVPVLIGAGIPLFGVTQRDITLKHIATRQFASGLVQSEYAVAV
jgi:dihydrofolate reductase